MIQSESLIGNYNFMKTALSLNAICLIAHVGVDNAVPGSHVVHIFLNISHTIVEARKLNAF